MPPLLLNYLSSTQRLLIKCVVNLAILYTENETIRGWLGLLSGSLVGVAGSLPRARGL